MSKSAAITIAVFITIFVGGFIIFATQNTGDNVSLEDYDANSIIAPDANNGYIGDHVRGSKDAEAFIVEYFDFSCPMCAQVAPILEDYISEKDGAFAIIQRHYPVQSSHPNSFAASCATEAAGLIKKPESMLADEEVASRISAGIIDDTFFFEMNDTLLKNQTVWYTVSADKRTDVIVDLFSRIAPEASTDEFLAHMGSEAVKSKVNFDFNLGKQQGVTGTPSFFLDGVKLEVNNIGSLETVLKPAVEAKLAK